jgi:protein TonB
MTSIAAPGWCGALELKRFYQRSMSVGIALAVSLHISLAAGVCFSLVSDEVDSKVEGGFPAMDSVVIDLRLPPLTENATPRIGILASKILPPTIGIPLPVPDDEVMEKVHFPTSDDLARISTPIAIGVGVGFGGTEPVVTQIPNLGIYFPSPDSFVAVDEMPVPIHRATPAYPEVAALTHISGVVGLRVLVDEEGKVRDALIQKRSGSNVGFEKAAKTAAYKSVYKPAVQNGRPVAVWVSYQVEFTSQR